MHLGAEDSSASKKNLAAARKALGESYTVALLSGIDALLSGNGAAAVRNFLAAQKRLPRRQLARTRAEFQTWLGRAYELKGELVLAKRTLEKAITAEPTLPRAHLVLGDVALGERRLGNAVAHYKKVTTLAPKAHPRAYLELGVVYAERRKPTLAKAAYEAYLELVPTGEGAVEAKENLARLR